MARINPWEAKKWASGSQEENDGFIIFSLLVVGLTMKNNWHARPLLDPDRPFRKIRASQYVDRRTLHSSETPIDELGGSETVHGSAGHCCHPPVHGHNRATVPPCYYPWESSSPMSYPTERCNVWEPQNQSIDDFELHKMRRLSDCEALILRYGCCGSYDYETKWECGG